jgi:hypothetical protein
MPRRSILSASERESLLALPDTQEDLIRRYTLNESDMAVVRQHRGAAMSARLCGAVLLPAFSRSSARRCRAAVRTLAPVGGGSAQHRVGGVG